MALTAAAATAGSLTLVVAGPAGADEAEPTILTIDGELVTVIVDRAGQHAAHEDELLTFVEVADQLHEVDSALVPDDASTGDTVTVTLEADAGLSPIEALEVATGLAPEVAEDAVVDVAPTADVEAEPSLSRKAVVRAEDAPVVDGAAASEDPAGPAAQEDGTAGEPSGTSDPTATPDDAPKAPADDPAPEPTTEPTTEPEPSPEATETTEPGTAAAEVIGVEVTGEGPAASELAEAAAGARTLTILPVYWTSRDSETQASLSSLATSTAQYWAEQSNGQIAITASSRDWRQIPNPGSCSSSVLWQSALAAHGISSVGADDHYAIYFPRYADCGGWAGLASIGGQSIWINGYNYRDVLAHEFGHNLGLGHANTTTCGVGTGRTPLVLPFGSCSVAEYADTADVMGYATTAASGNLNTAFADYLGLANVRRVTSTPVTVDLAPLSNVTALRGLAIPVVSGTLYVDFRPNAGRDTRQPAWAGVQVHFQSLASGYPKTYLLDMKAPSTSAFASPQMAPGARWTIPGTNKVLVVESVGSTARVSVTDVPVPVSAVDTVGVFRSGAWFLRGASGGVAGSYGYGNPTDIPVMGDWDGNGTRTPGVFRNGAWYLRNTNNQGGVDIAFTFGSPGDIPVVGDWNGDGKDTIGVFRRGAWYLRDSNTSGMQNRTLFYGLATDVPVTGDWNGDGTDTIGIFRGGLWHLTDSVTGGVVHHANGFGSPGDVPVVGDWNGDGTDTIGVARGGAFYLSNRLDRGYQDIMWYFGNPGDRPVVYK